MTAHVCAVHRTLLHLIGLGKGCHIIIMRLECKTMQDSSSILYFQRLHCSKRIL